jgi:secreted protein with Ig-like and vWFA domain
VDRLAEAASVPESLMRTTDQPVAADMLASSDQSLDKKLADTAPFGDDSRLAANAPAAPADPEAAAQPATALSLNESEDAYRFSGIAETEMKGDAAKLSGLGVQVPASAGRPMDLAQSAPSAELARALPAARGVTPGLEISAAPADGTLAGGVPGSAGGIESRMRRSLELAPSTRDASGVTMEFREGQEPRLVEKPASKENQVAYGRRESEARFLMSAPADVFFSTLDSEAYQDVPENPFLAVAGAPLSTFSIDVDTAGYANVRRFLNQGQRPPKAAVRLEEMVNYFRYDYPQPAGEVPFSVTVDLADCPWQPQHRLARVGLQGKAVPREQRPAANLVFLIDVSGSMDQPNKLPLVKQSLHLLTSQLKGGDHVAMVTYAGNSGVALPSTSLEQKETVTRAIDALSAGGSTNGASGLQLAYQQARQHFKAGGVNRVILATDGDFNVGLTSRDELHTLITNEAKGGVFLSVLGYGMGNLKDATMEMLADTGNGNYAYIDSLSEARKVLADQLEGTLMTIAKDVKVQVEFNPAQVRHYRLLGYENRLLAKEDFNDDRKDAGEIGAGHSVTALYEIVPHSAPAPQPPVDPLKYQPVPAAAAAPVAADQPASRESMTVKLRYKAPDGEASRLLEVPVVDENRKFAEAPADFKFAAGVAMTGLLLKDSAHKGAANWNLVRELARAGKGPDTEGYRGEFLQLIEKAAGVAP